MPAPRAISWADAEYLSNRLARDLRGELGCRLPGARFEGLPRGGLIVLGLLAYLLDLPVSAVSAEGGGEATVEGASDPLVLVDDCALSGARIAARLDGLDPSPDRPVIIALLLAPRPLVDAILAAEPRVEAVLVGEELRVLGDLPPAAAAAWRERLPGRRYWLGRTEPFSFPWNEPDQVLWNEREQRLESDWHRVSPRRSLGVWNDLGMTRIAEPGPLDLRDGVLWRRDGEGFVVWDADADRVFGFSDSAAEMWRALLAFGATGPAAQYLATVYDAPVEELAADLDRFVAECRERHLIT